MKSLKRNTIIFLLPLLAACAHAPQQDTERVDQFEAVEENKAELPDQFLPRQELTGQVLFGLLLADVAAQRGKPELAVQTYQEMANTTRDPRVARYATYLAFESRQLDKARELSKLWQELEPDSVRAKQMLVTLLLGDGKLNDARPHLVSLLAKDPDNIDAAFIQAYSMLARLPDKAASYDFLHGLAQPYPRAAGARWALAQLAEAAGKHDVAVEEARLAYDLHPEWDKAVLLNAQLLQDKSPQQALGLLKKYLASYPNNREVRIFYARALMGQKQYQVARAEFQLLLDGYPDNADLAFAVALLSLEMGELDRAEKELRQALANGKKDQNAVYYYLGQLSEAKKNEEEALQNYRKVADGEYAFSAQLRAAYLLNKAGKVEEARRVLHQADAQGNQQRVQLILFEAQILRNAKQQEAAYRLLEQGLEKLPDHPELLYETAMLADQMGKHEIFEQLIRKLIQTQPDYAHGYNALGYSLLDRNERVEEGMKLVEKAYQLVPGDAAIMDSVGWGHYRLGNLPKSEEFLRRAYAVNPDPEIAAHLGEVLWVKGDKEEAARIWQQALKMYPDHAVLTAVVKKFLP